jgi:hypothetical protein
MLLPTNYDPDGRLGQNAYQTSPSMNTCNNFLLGGNYYPGKDKKRRHYRTKAIWYRIFCSSGPRRIVTFIVSLYLFLWLPITHLLSTSQAPSLTNFDWLLRDTTLQLPTMEEQRDTASKLNIERDQLDAEGGISDRLRILEKIVPDWFHRNDEQPLAKPDVPVSSKTETQPIPTGDRIPQPRKDVDSEHIVEDRPPENDGKVHSRKARITRMKESNKDGVEKGNELANPKALEPYGGPALVVRKAGDRIRHLGNTDLFVNETKCPANLIPDDVQTTLVIQSSSNRLWILAETCKRWNDPIIAVIALTSTEDHDEVSALLSGWDDKCPHLQVIVYQMDTDEEKPEMYPVNRLRNIGLDAVHTSHVLVADVDFIPAQDLARLIRTTLLDRARLRVLKDDMIPKDQDAIVVPAFERLLAEPCTSEDSCKEHLRSNSSFIPHTFDDLRSCIAEKSCIVFQSKVNWEGHFSTHSEDWLKKKWYQGEPIAFGEGKPSVRHIRTLDCFDSLRYEPYVVLQWCPTGKPDPVRATAPYYDERFHGYGKNKIQYIQHLRLAGYQFAVLPEGFIVHNPHRDSKAKETWNNVKESTLHADMDRLYPTFLKELFQKYRYSKHRAVELCKQ